ncbi:MAG: BlaI/MecI/CopY family transcriptional regulator [Lachnospiraceae bacterium]
MDTPKIFESEYRFACIVWENEPVTTKKLIRLCQEKMEWKRTTTYTVLKRLCERGILKAEDSVVTSLYSKEEIQYLESRAFLDKTFEGSLPGFMAAFLKGKRISDQEIKEIREMLDEFKEQENGGPKG